MAIVVPKEPIFKVPEYARIQERMLSIHALNPFAQHDSSPRLTMLFFQLAQNVVLNHSEESIIQSGVDHQLGENTFSVKIEADCRVIGVAERYKSLGSNKEPIEFIIIVENIDNGEFTYYSVPYYFSLHQYFGFQYKKDIKFLKELRKGEFLPKGFILADSPSVKENSGYGFGVNANLCLITDPGTSEDGVIISKSFAEKISYDTFETRSISFGSDKFPLNIYGNENEYKGFPDIGELINEDSILAVLRENEEGVSFGQTSINDLVNFSHTCDHPVFVPGPGEERIDPYGNKVQSGIVVDIKAWENSKHKSRHNFFPITVGNTQKHVDGLRNFFKDILDIYYTDIKTCLGNNAKKNNVRKDGTIKMSSDLHNLIKQALAVGDTVNRPLPLTNRTVPLDRYKVDFVIKYNHVGNIGTKITDKNGAKGVTVIVRDDEYMPYDDNGVVYDIIMDPTSIISRMNIGRLYEQYFNAASRIARNKVRQHMASNPNDYKGAFDIVLRFLSIIDSEQYYGYQQATPEQMKIVVDECLERELYVMYRVSSKKPAYMIVHEIEESEFKPLKAPIHIKGKDGVVRTTKAPILGGPLYHMVLSKTPSDFLSAVHSSYVNHFGFPIAPSSTKANEFPIKVKPVRMVSETEFRSYLAYGGPKLIAELKHRANSLTDHEAIYKKILNTDKNGFVDNLIDRKQYPYNSDAALKILTAVFNAMGVKIDYVPDPSSYFGPDADPRVGLKKKVKK